jgi:hypothetical protein
MSRYGDVFNRSAFSRFMNSPAGRIFRILTGIGFLAFGYAYMDHWLGVVSMVWSILPISAGMLDICYISVILGGPISGKKIRGMQTSG